MKFTKDKCLVFDKNGSKIMQGSRSKNHCYLLESSDLKVLLTKEDLLHVWHNRLGHVNVQTLVKLSSTGAVRGLPKLNSKSKLICGDCAKGKQTKTTHKAVEQLSSSKCLELLHMDLIVPTEVESIGGKRYILVIVDD